MSHCFKGLWIILNERVRGQKCNILNILIYIQKNIAACRHYHIFRVTSSAFRVTVVTLWQQLIKTLRKEKICGFNVITCEETYM